MNKQQIPSLFRKKDYNRIYHSQFIILFYSFIQQSYWQKGILSYSSYIALLKLIGVSRHKFTSSSTSHLLHKFKDKIHSFIYNIMNEKVSYLDNLISTETAQYRNQHANKHTKKRLQTQQQQMQLVPFNTTTFSHNYEYLFSYFVIQYAYFKLHIISQHEMIYLLNNIGITTFQPHNNTHLLLLSIKQHNSFRILNIAFNNYYNNNNNNNNNNKQLQHDFIQPFAFIS